MASRSVFVYPRVAPNVESEVDGLGRYFSRGGEYPTDSIDYIRFTEINVDYEAGGGLSSVKRQASTRVDDLDSCYLYIPQSLGTDYGVNYNQINMGALGVEAASVLGSKAEDEIVGALQAAASSAVPESLFGTIASGIGAVNTLAGTSGAPTGGQLSSIGRGLAFNPFMEQIFEGVNFRTHSFSFKLIARNEEEAKEIARIVRFFKVAMLPKLDGGPKGNINSTGSSAAQGPSQNGESAAGLARKRTPDSRYLKVPNRFRIEFKRSTKIGDTIRSDSIKDIQGLYKFKECALTNVQVTYTPDGQYVSTDSGLVPALQMDLRFVELAILTKDDYDDNSLFGY
jgi:hypothetical protein